MTRSGVAWSLDLTPADAPRAERRVLIVDDDPAVLRLVGEILRSDPGRIEPLGAASAEEALGILAGGDPLDCLLVDIMLPGMDGLQLLVSARDLRPELKIVAMTSAPNDDLERAVLESGATRLLAKPLDLEELTASVAAERPGSVSHLLGDLDLLDICCLSAACQGDGGVRVRQGKREGILAHHGTTLVHAAAAGLTGAPAWAGLRAWSPLQFASLSAVKAARLAGNCALEMAAAGEAAPGAKAAGSLRGLTLRHLIEWAMRSRQTSTLTVTSQRRTGIFSFAAGTIDGAETADREGGLAASEILGWEDVRVELIRSPAAAPARLPAGSLGSGKAPAGSAGDPGGLAATIARFAGEIEGFLATGVARRADGSLVGGRSPDPTLDVAAAAGAYSRVIDSHLAAVAALGMGAAWGETVDVLITTANTYLLIRLLGERHYHWLAVSSDSNPALYRLRMRSHEELLLAGLAEMGEIPRRGA